MNLGRPDWYRPETLPGGQLHRRVTISPAWAALANPPFPSPSQNTITAFDKLFAATISSALTNYLTPKIEAIRGLFSAPLYEFVRFWPKATTSGKPPFYDGVLRTPISIN